MINEISIDILYVNSSKVNDRALLTLSELIHIDKNTEMNPSVYKKHVLGRWLISTFLTNKGISEHTINRMKYGEFGKPYISGIPSFNVSHSNDIVICTMANKGEVGIDIEYIHTLQWQNYKDCFSIEEWQRISLGKNPSSILLEFWTKKESILKGDGRGLQVQLSDVVLDDQYEFGNIRAEKKKWYFKPVYLNGYFCYVSSEFPISEVNLKEIEV